METIKMKTQKSKMFSMQQNGPRREYSNTGLPQEAQTKLSNMQTNYIPKGARKRTTTET